jgi:hypothetical protein
VNRVGYVEPRSLPLAVLTDGNEKTTIQNQKVFDSRPVLLYKGSGTSIVLGYPEQGSDRFKGNTRRWPGLLPDWQHNQ